MGQADPVQALSGRLSAAVDDLVALDADTLTVDEAGALIEAVERDRNRLDAARTKLMASFSRRDGHRASGHKDLGHWMADRLRRSPGQARKEAKTAEQLGGLSATAEALGNGDISLEHAAAIAEQAGKLDDPEGAQRSLLAEARTGDPRRVRKAGRRMRRDEARRAEAARKVQKAKERRTLSFRPDETEKTMWIEGRLPLVAGMKVRTAVDALAAPAGADDERTYGQRTADALVELAERARSRDGLPSQRGVPVELMAVVPVEALEGRADVPAGTLIGGPGGGIDLSHAELADIVKQADLSWLIVDPAGVPLRYGKSRRFASEDQRRVLRARDGGCVWPRCDAPGVWALVHHEPPFDEPDGATDIATQGLVCDTDHERRHKGGWTLTLDPDGTATATSPDGSIVLTETAAQRRARHGTWELSEHIDPQGTGNHDVPATDHAVAHETPATYRARPDRGRDPPAPRTGRVQRERRDPGQTRLTPGEAADAGPSPGVPEGQTGTRRPPPIADHLLRPHHMHHPQTVVQLVQASRQRRRHARNGVPDRRRPPGAADRHCRCRAGRAREPGVRSAPDFRYCRYHEPVRRRAR